MVGKRAWAPDPDRRKSTFEPNTTLSPTTSGGRKAASRHSDSPSTSIHHNRPRPNAFRSTPSYRDTPASPAQSTTLAAEVAWRDQLKTKLLNGVDRDNLEKYRISDKDLKALKKQKGKKIKAFYESQNERLNDWLEVDAIVTALSDDVLESFNPDPDFDGILENAGALQNIGEDVEAFLPDGERERRKKDAKRAWWAININVIANVLLLLAKIGAVFYSDSLSLVASLVDSALDLLCTLIVWTTNRLVQWRLKSLKARFPVGRRRLEPLGILVFSIIMVISFAQILQESVTRLLPSGDHSLVNLPPVAIGAMASTIVVKGLIWLVCMPVKTTQVQALAQDCKTDVFFNTLSLLFPILGTHLKVWWLDPVGAAILSLFIIYDWGKTSFENVVRLSGSSVSDRLLQKIIYVAYRFESLVNGIKSVTAYHAGDGVWAEVDVLLDPKEELMKAHDIAETMQYCLEGLSEIDRAFVTIDYTSLGPTGHSTVV